MKFLIALLSLMFLYSCSTYSKKECLEMDQVGLGFKDGSVGVSSFEIPLNHFKNTCEKDHGILPSSEKIKMGYDSGKRFYCSGPGAEKAGSTGLTYTGICTKEEEKGFFEKFNPARMSFLENKVKELEVVISNLKNELSSAESKASSAESRASDAESRAASCTQL